MFSFFSSVVNDSNSYAPGIVIQLKNFHVGVGAHNCPSYLLVQFSCSVASDSL